MNRWLGNLKDGLKRLYPDRHDVFVFGGTGLIALGAWKIYEPAAYVVAGVICLWLGLRGLMK